METNPVTENLKFSVTLKGRQKGSKCYPFKQEPFYDSFFPSTGFYSYSIFCQRKRRVEKSEQKRGERVSRLEPNNMPFYFTYQGIHFDARWEGLQLKETRRQIRRISRKEQTSSNIIEIMSTDFWRLHYLQLVK